MGNWGTSSTLETNVYEYRIRWILRQFRRSESDITE